NDRQRMKCFGYPGLYKFPRPDNCSKQKVFDMKHRTIAIGLVTALLLFLMAWSFVSSAASGSNPAANDSSAANETSVPPQGDENESIDADLGKFGSRIDRDEYLRLRDEYIGLKRGIEPGRPFNPE